MLAAPEKGVKVIRTRVRGNSLRGRGGGVRREEETRHQSSRHSNKAKPKVKTTRRKGERRSEENENQAGTRTGS